MSEKSCNKCKYETKYAGKFCARECGSQYEDFEPKDGPQKLTSKYERIGRHIGELVGSKQISYGNAATETTPALMKQFYPDGIKPEQYQQAYLVIMVANKLSRIAKGDTTKFNENDWSDLVGYGILGVSLGEDGTTKAE